MSAPADRCWTAQTLLAALEKQGLPQPGGCPDGLVQAANRLADLQRLLASQLPQAHLPAGIPQALAPIADWLA